MQHADLFDRSKVVYRAAEATVVDDFDDAHVQRILDVTRDSEFGVVAIFDSERVYWRDKNVTAISDGQRRSMLDDLLPLEATNAQQG
jgi:acetolactate synthase regulatory subunit